METSMLRMIKELKQLQSTRKAEQACAVAKQPVRESPPARREKSDLKKRSQLATALTVTKSCAGKDYDDRASASPGGNKAELSQFPTRALACQAGKGGIAAAHRALQ